jgi:aminoglycoside phosphotransferase (APT) family kinase protein
VSEEQPPDLDLARRLVAAQFPQWAELPVRPVELSGWDNRTFRLGEALSIRMPRSGSYREQVAKEQYWLPRLAPQLPQAVPRPVAEGAPGLGYPYAWSVYAWIDGDPATTERVADPVGFARDVAAFLVALRSCDPTGGPGPGSHNFGRGGSLELYRGDALAALDRIADELADSAVATARQLLAQAVASSWTGDPVWFHGDIAFGNLLVRDGRLAAVIDFGTSGVGDPACDLALAWTMLTGAARRAYADGLALDHDTWVRGRGWTLWKALITVAGHRGGSSADRVAADDARRVLREVLADPVG